MSPFAYLTPATYALLVILWSIVAVFYFRRTRRAWRQRNPLLHTLLLVLLLDASRTIFESAFFGVWYSAKLGFLPQSLYDFLVQPQIVFVPKAINILVALVVILIILRRWLPQEELENAARRARESLLEETVLARTESLREMNRKLEEDIAARVRAEQRLSRSETARQSASSNFETVIESIPDALILTDTERRVTTINSGFAALFGYTAAEVVGEPTSTIYESEEEFINQGRTRFNTSASRKGDPYLVNYRRKDGSIFPGETTGGAVVSPTGDVLGFFGLIRDASERLRKEEIAREAQKLEALGTLSGGIAHDFNNILTAILGFAALIDEREASGSKNKEDIQEVVQAGQRAKELVTQILTFSRKGESARTLVRMKQVVSEAMRLLRQTLPSTIEIVLDLDMTEDTVFADPTQVHQICLNLGTNAYHAMRETGGTLTVTLRSVEIGAARSPEVAGLPDGPYVRLSIEDTGSGMDPGTAAKAFEPFFTTKPQGEGTGMGLAVVHGIVTGHGGGIEIASRPGVGTRVDVYLPARVGLPEWSGGSDEVVPESAPFRAARILVVDDEPALARVLGRILTKMGHSTECVTSSVEALDRFRGAPEAFDLVLTDQTMPKLSGAELTTALLEIRPDLPVILCTGHSDTLDEARAKEIGARALVSKPPDLTRLARLVQDALARPQSGAGRNDSPD